MAHTVPFLLDFGDQAPYYGHDIFPNRMYRRLHAREHVPLDMHTLGLIGRLGAHGHHLASQKHGTGCDPAPLSHGTNKHPFNVSLDVGLFQPEELSVKIVNDYIVVQGKHEEREDDHGHISRHFVRRYHLPKNYDAAAVVSTLSSDGVLTVTLPKPEANDDEENVRVVPIKQIGPSDLFLKGDPKDTNGSNGRDNPESGN